MLASSTRPPTVEEVKKLTSSDFALMTALSDSLRDNLAKFMDIDPHTRSDPFDDKDDYSYSIVVDRENPNRVVAMIANKKDPLPQLPWSMMLGERLVKLSVSKDEAKALKNELAPKATYNFYPYRRSGKISGYIMFAFQICGQR